VKSSDFQRSSATKIFSLSQLVTSYELAGSSLSAAAIAGPIVIPQSVGLPASIAQDCNVVRRRRGMLQHVWNEADPVRRIHGYKGRSRAAEIMKTHGFSDSRPCVCYRGVRFLKPDSSSRCDDFSRHEFDVGQRAVRTAT
jgi:hypothetical protein